MDVSWNGKTNTVAMTGGSRDVKIRKMAFYHELYAYFSGFSELFMNFKYDIGVYRTEQAKDTINAGMIKTIKTNATALNKLYEGLSKDKLSTAEDTDIIEAVNRLTPLILSNIEAASTTSSQGEINAIQQVSQTALMDSLTYSSKTNNAFMSAYCAIE